MRIGRIKILYAHNSADIYGASRSLARLVGKLDKDKFAPTVLLPQEGPLRQMLEAAGAEVRLFPQMKIITRKVFRSPQLAGWLLGFIPATLKQASMIRREGYDIAHSNTGVICSHGLAARLAGVPHVWHIRDWFQEFGPVWKPYSRFILAVSQKVLCVSGPIAGQFPTNRKVDVLHNGFDLAEFPTLTSHERAGARMRWGIRSDDIVAASVGRIKFVRKGQEFLLHACAELRARGRNIVCLLAGGAAPGAEDHEPRMKALACELGVRAFFTGELEDPRPAYAAADIFVLPSAQPEPFGGVVMEAMSLGLPVVGTAVGGTPEQVEDGRTGILVPPGEPLALADAINTLVEHPDTAREMGRLGRRRISDQFSLDKMVSRLECVYSHILGHRSQCS